MMSPELERSIADLLTTNGIDPSRILIGLVGERFQLRRLCSPGTAIDVGEAFAAGLANGCDVMLRALWPDCPPDVERKILGGIGTVAIFVDPMLRKMRKG